MWDLPGPGLKPVSPELAGRFLTTAPPGKPHSCESLKVGSFVKPLQFCDKYVHIKETLWKGGKAFLIRICISACKQVRAEEKIV